MPVQPVCIRYTNEACDPSWVSGGPGPGEIALKMLCQVRCDVDCLARNDLIRIPPS